jgi:hypothetical protein
MVLVPVNEQKQCVMKNEDNKKNEERVKSATATQEQANSGREQMDSQHKKETMEEKAQRENWTDIAESHLGIDE